ncbi:MAG: mobilization protein, partial [Prevotella sp.]|nr:mobilization protein [Prevotella sp.]
MGYAVLHLEKAKGAGSGMSAHIERTIQPKNADPKRTHLNRELIQFSDGVHNRTEAIQHRLDTVGLRRKIGK